MKDSMDCIHCLSRFPNYLFQLAELEGRNKELSKQRDKLFRELDKARKELMKTKTKANTEKPKKELEKGRKEAKRKPPNQGSTSPSGASEKVAEKEQLYEEFRNEYDVSG